jgi:hypothetical protein
MRGCAEYTEPKGEPLSPKSETLDMNKKEAQAKITAMLSTGAKKQQDRVIGARR